MKLSLSSLLVGAGALATLLVASCATDAIVAIENPADDGGSTIIPPTDSGGPALKCGNGVLDDGEGCDDGNAKDGDGCSAACKVEGTTPGGSCPGAAVPMTSPSPTRRVGSVAGDTTTNAKSFESATCGGGNGNDVVYSVTSDIAGRARVVLDAKFDAYLALRSACGDAKTESACKAVPIGGGKTELLFPVTAKQTTYVIVDGVAGKSGAYRLDVEIDATTCGDGIAQWPEQCDDGAVAPGDGCSAGCLLETPLSAPGKCPGATYTFVGGTVPKTVSFAGDTSTLASTASSLGCSSGGGKDQVYAITPTISGALKSVLKASYPEAQLHARRECFTSQSQMDCRVQPLANVPLEMTIPVVANQTYYVFVDGDSGSPGGKYTLDVTLAPATCGNGVLEAPEACDDNNTANNDGCSSTCTLETPPAGLDTCPGAPITLNGAAGGPMTFVTSASTAPLTTGVRAGCGSAGTKDAVYSFVAPYNGWVDARLLGAFNAVLDLRADCTVAATNGAGIRCVDVNKGNGLETVSGAIEAGKTYFLVVKGALPTTENEGPFTLSVNTKPSVCGNGIIEGGETCDDGATDDGDTCSATCQIEPLPVPEKRTTCANAEDLGLVEGPAGVWTKSVVGGNWNGSDSAFFSAPCAGAGKEAYFTVTPPISGIVIAKTVSSYNISLGARAACPPFTSTGFLTCSDKRTPANETISFPGTAGTKYWIIVDAPSDNDRGRFTLDVTVKAESCGDGLVSGAEQCDDGNTVAGDGCSPTCTLEASPTADTCPGRAITMSGAGSAIRTKVFTLSTSAMVSNYAGTCGGNSRDGVVAVTSDITGTMRGLLTSSWPSVFYARSTCTNGGAELGCNKADLTKPNDIVRELTFPVVANVPVYLFVDGLDGSSGPATMFLTVTP